MNNITREQIAQAFGRANLQNARDAAAILAFGKDNTYTTTEVIAAAIRFGYTEGKRESKEKIHELHQRIHNQQNSAEDYSWMNDPDELLTASAFMAGRAVALKAGNAVKVPVATQKAAGTAEGNQESPS